MTGIVLFSKLQWNEAVGFLSIAGVDPRELISFFPDLIPPSCKGTYETPNTQNVVSISTPSSSRSCGAVVLTPSVQLEESAHHLQMLP